MNPSVRPLLVIGVIVLGVASVVGVSEWRAAHAKEIIPWRDDFTAAQAEARQKHKPVFAYFTAAWCGPCQSMKKTTWADNAVKEAMEKFIPVKIDVDAQPALTEKFGVRSMPSYIVMSEDGEVIRQRSGLMVAEEMVAWLEK